MSPIRGGETGGHERITNLAFDVPWLNLLAIFAGVYVASLLATLAPARRASRVYPSETLRYQ